MIISEMKVSRRAYSVIELHDLHMNHTQSNCHRIVDESVSEDRHKKHNHEVSSQFGHADLEIIVLLEGNFFMNDYHLSLNGMPNSVGIIYF